MVKINKLVWRKEKLHHAFVAYLCAENSLKIVQTYHFLSIPEEGWRQRTAGKTLHNTEEMVELMTLHVLSKDNHSRIDLSDEVYC